MSKQIIQRIKGTRDFYPEDMKKRAWLLAKIEQVMKSFGYEEYTTPILESMDLYAAKSSEEIVERQSYVIEDRSGEKLVLRPEMTPSLARLVATKQAELPDILRWFSVPDCWRYEAPQKGRLRNFLQLNVDLLGSDSVEADTEVISIAIRILETLGVDLQKITVQLSDRALMRAIYLSLGIREETHSALFGLLDRKKKITPEEFTTALENLGITGTTLQRFTETFEKPEQLLTMDARGERLQKVIERLKAFSCTIVFDPTIARGFEYYTGVVFEVVETAGTFKRSIFGGGRYDNLLEVMGGKPMTGIGFGVSDIVLETVLEEQGKAVTPKPEKKVMVFPFSEAERDAAEKIVSSLREQSEISVLMALPPYALKKQLKLASDLGVTTMILLFPDELAKGVCIKRDMSTGEQKEIEIKILSSELL